MIDSGLAGNDDTTCADDDVDEVPKLKFVGLLCCQLEPCELDDACCRLLMVGCLSVQKVAL